MDPKIAFDEAGNTGQNLLDATQPVFVSAGVRLSDDDVGELRELLAWSEDEELHFVTLRKSAKGLERIGQLLGSRFTGPEHARFMTIHKPYMITTKIVDILVEEVAYADGVDLYKKGGHATMANMYFFLAPAFCGAERYQRLLDLFVEMIRHPRVRPIRQFYETAREMMDVCSDNRFAASLAPLVKSADHIGEILERRTITDLDPAVPAFVSVAAAWDVAIGAPWSVIHDASKPIAFDQDVLEAYMTDDAEPERFREDVDFQLPLAATGISFADSAEVPALQVADIVASAAAHLLRGKIDAARRDDTWFIVEQTSIMDASVGAVWPAPLFTPKELGMEDFDGRHLEKANELISRAMTEKYGPNWAELRQQEKQRARKKR